MYPSYYEFDYLLEEAELLFPLLMSRGTSSSLFGIAAYVLTALGLYAIAKRRCINHPWLAWVPVGNLWLLGSLSDQYCYVVKGQIKSKRKTLLWLKVISLGLTISMVAMGVAVVAKVITGLNYGMRGDRILEDLVGPLLVMGGIALPLAGVSIASAIFYYMALYDVYTSCDPNNNVLFLVLSILFGNITKPFFLFFSREKDLGMPPRRETAVWEEPQEQSQPIMQEDPQDGWAETNDL